jgi:hypothetical protein
MSKAKRNLVVNSEERSEGREEGVSYIFTGQMDRWTDGWINKYLQVKNPLRVIHHPASATVSVAAASCGYSYRSRRGIRVEMLLDVPGAGMGCG